MYGLAFCQGVEYTISTVRLRAAGRYGGQADDAIWPILTPQFYDNGCRRRRLDSPATNVDGKSATRSGCEYDPERRQAHQLREDSLASAPLSDEASAPGGRAMQDRDGG